MTNPKIYYLCPDRNIACGGVKILYSHVDILNNNGFDAYILHRRKNFRCTWFDNNTAISYMHNIQIEPSDYLVLPESSERTFIKKKRWIEKGKRRERGE